MSWQRPAWRIVEVSAAGPVGRAAALAGKLFAGHGHEVVQVVTDLPDPLDPERLWRDTGKRRTRLDWTQAGDRAALERLLAGADLLLDATGPGGLTASGLDAERLRARFPELVAVQLSAFGHRGPCRDYAAEEITLYAMSGLMHATGDSDCEPLNAGVAVASDSAGLKAHIAALMALYRRGRDGGGDVVELSVQDAAMENIEIALAQWLNAGQLARRNGDEHAMVPWRTYDCADGEAVITSGPMRHWLRGARLFEAPELLDDGLASMADRITQRERVAELMAPWLTRMPRAEVFHAGQQAGLAWGHVATLSEALACEQTRAREAVAVLATSDGRSYRLPDAPFHASAMPWRTQPAPAAEIGPDTIDWAPRTPLVATPRTGRAPLAGVRVLDFSHDWAGPHAARVLADYGAEVIKIEYPRRLDGMRGGYRERIDDHPRFWQLHRNKRSVTLDLEQAEHYSCVCRLASDADIVLENSRPGVMAGLGLDYPALRELRADIIMVSMSAFGATGPHSGYAGYGGTIEALSGLQSLTGYAGDARTRRVREMDVVNGVFGANAAMAALVYRQRTGHGQWVDLSERETCAWLAGPEIVARDLGALAERRGNRHARFAPQGCYACRGEDRWLTIAIRDNADWRALCEVMDAPDWMRDAGMNDVAARRDAHDAIDAVIAAWTADRPAERLESRLQARGVPAGMVRNARDLAEDAHLAARAWFVDVTDACLPGLPFAFLRGGGAVRHRGPALGADNAMLRDAAGASVASPERADLGTAFDNGTPDRAALSDQP